MARILLGVTGGISAYKAVEVVRLATKAGHSVRVVQTPASLNFVGRETFEGVTGAPVLVDVWRGAMIESRHRGALQHFRKRLQHSYGEFHHPAALSSRREFPTGWSTLWRSVFFPALFGY